MEKFRYILEPYSGIKSRFSCPNCQKTEKTYTRYIDVEIGDYLPYEYGRRNRENNCNYFLNPYNNEFLKEQDLNIKNTSFKPVKTENKHFDCIDAESLLNTLKNYNNNHLITFLSNHFNAEIVNKLISRYFIGTSSHWNGSTVFWQIDIEGKIRTGKIMQYDPLKGRRIKEPYNHIYWIHKALKLDSFELKQCFFGEHLLKGNNKPVAIVESEKTAIISSVYFPQFIWVAVGSITNLTKERCKILLNRNVYLFPDLKAFDKWDLKANELGFKTFDYLELNATEQEKTKGLDLADYLLKN